MIQVNALGPTLVLRHLLSTLVQPTIATAGTARRRVPRQAADAQIFERSSE